MKAACPCKAGFLKPVAVFGGGELAVSVTILVERDLENSQAYKTRKYI